MRHPVSTSASEMRPLEMCKMLRVWARLCLSVFAISVMIGAPSLDAAPRKPNIVILIIDDAALMDLGVYGGEAKTPHIDALAAGGTLFTQYRSSPLCAPSRAMLLTGLDNHLTGIATIPEVLPPSQKGKPGYAMRLEAGVKTLADHLKPEGYQSFMTGKWHLGHAGAGLPNDHGFDRSYALDASGADNWSQKSYLPYYSTAPWYEDGHAASLPEDFYSSAFIVEQMQRYLTARDPAQPFLSVLGFQAIHIPVQAPPELVTPYIEVYRQGWDNLRDRRMARAKAIGLVPEVALAPNQPMRAWASLAPEEQELYAQRMAVNAAMLEAMDFHIGRLIAYLKEDGQFDNTIFVVTSDNGAEPNSPTDDARMRFWLKTQGYDPQAQPMGGPNSYGFIGRDWAMAASGPALKFKFATAEGGVRVPLIMAGPGIASRMKTPAMAWVSDIAPTLLDILGVRQAEGRPMTGRSLKPIITGQAEQIYRSSEAQAIEVSGNAALYLDGYKITRNLPPFGDGVWRLFNLTRDPGETHDLARQEPERFAQLLRAYSDYEARVGVQPMPAKYNAIDQITSNTIRKQAQRFGPLLALAVAAILFLMLLWWRRRA